MAAHLHDDGARVLARPPGDAARIAGRAALLAGDLAEGRIRADAADHKAVVVGHRRHLGRIELDHRVVEVVVARDHDAQRASVLRGLGGDLRAGTATVRGGEADHLAGGIGADRRQGAHGVPIDDDAGPATHRDPVVGGCVGWEAYNGHEHGYHRRLIATVGRLQSNTPIERSDILSSLLSLVGWGLRFATVDAVAAPLSIFHSRSTGSITLHPRQRLRCLDAGLCRLTGGAVPGAAPRPTSS